MDVDDGHEACLEEAIEIKNSLTSVSGELVNSECCLENELILERNSSKIQKTAETFSLGCLEEQEIAKIDSAGVLENETSEVISLKTHSSAVVDSSNFSLTEISTGIKCSDSLETESVSYINPSESVEAQSSFKDSLGISNEAIAEGSPPDSNAELNSSDLLDTFAVSSSDISESPAGNNSSLFPETATVVESSHVQDYQTIPELISCSDVAETSAVDSLPHSPTPVSVDSLDVPEDQAISKLNNPLESFGTSEVDYPPISPTSTQVNSLNNAENSTILDINISDAPETENRVLSITVNDRVFRVQPLSIILERCDGNEQSLVKNFNAEVNLRKAPKRSYEMIVEKNPTAISGNNKLSEEKQNAGPSSNFDKALIEDKTIIVDDELMRDPLGFEDELLTAAADNTDDFSADCANTIQAIVDDFISSCDNAQSSEDYSTSSAADVKSVQMENNSIPNDNSLKVPEAPENSSRINKNDVKISDKKLSNSDAVSDMKSSTVMFESDLFSKFKIKKFKLALERIDKTERYQSLIKGNRDKKSHDGEKYSKHEQSKHQNKHKMSSEYRDCHQKSDKSKTVDGKLLYHRPRPDDKSYSRDHKTHSDENYYRKIADKKEPSRKRDYNCDIVGSILGVSGVKKLESKERAAAAAADSFKIKETKIYHRSMNDDSSSDDDIIPAKKRIKSRDEPNINNRKFDFKFGKKDSSKSGEYVRGTVVSEPIQKMSFLSKHYNVKNDDASESLYQKYDSIADALENICFNYLKTSRCGLDNHKFAHTIPFDALKKFTVSTEEDLSILRSWRKKFKFHSVVYTEVVKLFVMWKLDTELEMMAEELLNYNTAGYMQRWLALFKNGYAQFNVPPEDGLRRILHHFVNNNIPNALIKDAFENTHRLYKPQIVDDVWNILTPLVNKNILINLPSDIVLLLMERIKLLPATPSSNIHYLCYMFNENHSLLTEIHDNKLSLLREFSNFIDSCNPTDFQKVNEIVKFRNTFAKLVGEYPKEFKFVGSSPGINSTTMHSDLNSVHGGRTGDNDEDEVIDMAYDYSPARSANKESGFVSSSTCQQRSKSRASSGAPESPNEADWQAERSVSPYTPSDLDFGGISKSRPTHKQPACELVVSSNSPSSSFSFPVKTNASFLVSPVDRYADNRMQNKPVPSDSEGFQIPVMTNTSFLQPASFAGQRTISSSIEDGFTTPFSSYRYSSETKAAPLLVNQSAAANLKPVKIIDSVERSPMQPPLTVPNPLANKHKNEQQDKYKVGAAGSRVSPSKSFKPVVENVKKDAAYYDDIPGCSRRSTKERRSPIIDYGSLPINRTMTMTAVTNVGDAGSLIDRKDEEQMQSCIRDGRTSGTNKLLKSFAGRQYAPSAIAYSVYSNIIRWQLSNVVDFYGNLVANNVEDYNSGIHAVVGVHLLYYFSNSEQIALFLSVFEIMRKNYLDFCRPPPQKYPTDMKLRYLTMTSVALIDRRMEQQVVQLMFSYELLSNVPSYLEGSDGKNLNLMADFVTYFLDHLLEMEKFDLMYLVLMELSNNYLLFDGHIAYGHYCKDLLELLLHNQALAKALNLFRVYFEIIKKDHIDCTTYRGLVIAAIKQGNILTAEVIRHQLRKRNPPLTNDGIQGVSAVICTYYTREEIICELNGLFMRIMKDIFDEELLQTPYNIIYIQKTKYNFRGAKYLPIEDRNVPTTVCQVKSILNSLKPAIKIETVDVFVILLDRKSLWNYVRAMEKIIRIK